MQIPPQGVVRIYSSFDPDFWMNSNLSESRFELIRASDFTDQVEYKFTSTDTQWVIAYCEPVDATSSPPSSCGNFEIQYYKKKEEEED